MDQNLPAAPFFFASSSEAVRASPSAQHPQQQHFHNGHVAPPPHQQQYGQVQQQQQHEVASGQSNSLADALARLQASVGSNPLPLPLGSPPVQIKQEDTPAYVPVGHISHTPVAPRAMVQSPSNTQAPVPAATLELIADLRAEMRRMANRIQDLETNTKEAASEAQLAMRRPLLELESEMAALRSASKARFEAIEKHTNALHTSTVALMSKLNEGGGSGEGGSMAAERSTPRVSKEEEEQAELRKRQERRRKELEEEWYGKAGRPTLKLENSSLLDRDAEPSSSSRSDRKRTIDQVDSVPHSRAFGVTTSAPARHEREASVARQSLSTSDFTRVPTEPASVRAATLRDRSPLRSAPPTGPRANMEATQSSLVKRLRLTESPWGERGSGERNGKAAWDASVPLQATPLAGGEGFEVVVRAMKNIYREKHIEPGTALDSSTVASYVTALQPDVLARYKADKWSQFLVMAQRYVAVVLRLNDKARLTKGGCELLKLRDLDTPYFARIVTPPPYFQQREMALTVLGDEAEPSSSAASTRATSSRREASSSQQTLPSSQQTMPSSSAGSQPGQTERTVINAVPIPPYTLPHVASLPPNLFPQWHRQLESPDYFYVLVDSLREATVPHGTSAHAPTATIYRAVEARMGEEAFGRMIRAVKGFKTYLGAASRFVKLAWQSKEHAHVLTLLDSDAPFFEEKDNVDYFKHVDEWRAKAAAARFR